MIMKMNFLFSELFWGALLILFGASIIIKTVFGINIPVLRTIFALLLIYGGVVIMSGVGTSKQTEKKQTIAFEEKFIKPDKAYNTYTIAFGKGTIDLTNIASPQELRKIKINTLFGAGVVRIDGSIPTKIIVNAAFAGTKLPNENMVSFGTYTFKTKQNEQPRLEIEANVVFGGLEIIST